MSDKTLQQPAISLQAGKISLVLQTNFVNCESRWFGIVLMTSGDQSVGGVTCLFGRIKIWVFKYEEVRNQENHRGEDRSED